LLLLSLTSHSYDVSVASRVFCVFAAEALAAIGYGYAEIAIAKKKKGTRDEVEVRFCCYNAFVDAANWQLATVQGGCATFLK
jgi:hypothetical protein